MGARILRDYRCTACDAVTEHWGSTEEIASLACPECGNAELVYVIKVAPKLDYTRMATDGTSSDACNTAISKWDKMRRQKMAIERKLNNFHGPEAE